MKYNVTALMPMKGNSERVPNKNIRPFSGKPLFHMVLTQLEACPLIESIIINTDSEKIMELASPFSKVRLLRRPEHICGDHVPMNDIIAHDVSFVETEHILQTHSTNPLLTLPTLTEAIQSYFETISQYDSLFSVTVWQSRFYTEDGTPLNHNPNELLRTQDLPLLCEENSCMYIFSKKSFLEAGNRRIGLRPRMFLMNKLESVDIDNEEDFILAETLFRYKMDIKNTVRQ